MGQKYNRDYSFSSSSDEALTRQKLDQEFDLVGNAIAAVYAVLAKSFNDDGSLRAGVVDGKAISKSVVLLPEQAEKWKEGSKYKTGSIIYYDSAILWCEKPHTAVNMKDESSFWHTVIDFKPFMRQVESLANNPRVARISANMDIISEIAPHVAKIIEVQSQMDEIKKINENLPVLQMFSQIGGNTIRDLLKLTGVIEEIKTVASFVKQIRQLGLGLDGLMARTGE